MTTVKKRLDRIEKELGLKSKKTQTTRILVVQDRSGSMQSRVKETISGFNEYVDDLAQDNSDEAFLTLVQFDDEYLVTEEDTPVAKVKSLNEDTFVPRGMTALLDAVGRGITDLKKRMNDDDRALVVIMTDGGENSSSEYTRDQIQKMIRDCEKEGNWTFVFLGAGTDSWSGGSMLGLRRNQGVFYGADSHSHGVAYKGLAATTTSLRSGTSMSSVDPGLATASVMSSLGADVQINDSQKSLFDQDETDSSEE